jgi:hypothetical protein
MNHRMPAIEAHDVMEVSMPELDDVVRWEEFPAVKFFGDAG